MTISAALIAGGKSSRMGRDKATLPWRGRPLYEWQLEKLRALHPEKIFLSAGAKLSWRPADADLILDEAPSRGPLSGLAATLSAMETDHLLALAVDMPFMTTAQLRLECNLLTSETGVIPIIDGKAEPLAAFYPKSAQPIFLQALRGDNFALQPIVRTLIDRRLLKEMPVIGADRKLYKSVNEASDLGDGSSASR